MSSYFLLVPQITEAGLVSRLGQVIELYPIEMGIASQTFETGDVCFVSGKGIMALSDNERGQLTSVILRRGAHLVIIPPLPREPLPRLLRDVDPPEFRDAPFSPVTIVEEELRQACGLDQLTILYNQVICTSTGKPLAVTSAGKPVIVRYQHLSTWGQLLCTTLLLGSTSSRSQRTHRIALAQGMVSWLTQVSPEAVALTPIAPSAALDLTYELPIILMAVHLAQRDGALVEEQLKPTVDQVRAKLSRHRDDFQLSKTVARLEAIGILSPQGEGRWKVDSRQLAEEINRQHLTSYLRRLR